MEYAPTISFRPVFKGGVQVGYTTWQTKATLLQIIAAHPGAIWLIGNEPDCTAMDNMTSYWYARAYHDVYHFIKSVDPTAQIAAGNIVQPTRQRFAYLDRVLAAYQTLFGVPLPADLWSTHNYILCENCYPTRPPGEPFAWGACWVPDWPSADSSAALATFYSVYDHWDVDVFTQRLMDFRQWMTDNGYGHHPLIVPEYGILFYEGLVPGMTSADDIQFMNKTFDWMLTARDDTLGYVPDDGRLMQRWAWYSIGHGDYPGGSLFMNGKPTAHGVAYHEYTSQLQPEVHLQTLGTSLSAPVAPPNTSVTATVAVTISNSGNISSQFPLRVALYAQPGDKEPAQSETIRPLKCCGDHEPITLTWQNYVAGEYADFYIVVRPDPPYTLFLPLALRTFQ